MNATDYHPGDMTAAEYAAHHIALLDANRPSPTLRNYAEALAVWQRTRSLMCRVRDGEMGMREAANIAQKLANEEASQNRRREPDIA